jgi:predicted nucleic acid-binding protein
MTTLLDTNIVMRTAQPQHPMYQEALDAQAVLRQKGEQLCLAPQNFYEFWVVCTRPAAINGLGSTAAQAQVEITRLKNIFKVLDDTPAVFTTWEQLVVQHQVLGKNAHDARLVAAMLVHKLDQLLTFNKPDFQRYQGINVVTPTEVLASASTP